NSRSSRPPMKRPEPVCPTMATKISSNGPVTNTSLSASLAANCHQTPPSSTNLPHFSPKSAAPPSSSLPPRHHRNNRHNRHRTRKTHAPRAQGHHQSL